METSPIDPIKLMADIIKGHAPEIFGATLPFERIANLAIRIGVKSAKNSFADMLLRPVLILPLKEIEPR